MIEQCGDDGVIASGSSTRARCTDITVSRCDKSGVIANTGASVILEGSETSILTWLI